MKMYKFMQQMKPSILRRQLKTYIGSQTTLQQKVMCCQYIQRHFVIQAQPQTTTKYTRYLLPVIFRVSNVCVLLAVFSKYK